MNKKFYKLDIIPEGKFHAIIKDYTLSSTPDNKTTFLCLTLYVRHNEDSFEVNKYFVVDKGRNRKLYEFIREMGFLHKHNKVSYDELLNSECIIDLYYNSDGKLIVGDIEPAEDDDLDFTEEDEYDEE